MIVVDFWGDYACFTPPYAKVERMTLPAPTPGVVRNMLQAIYGKPQEFWWQVVKIEIMRPLKYYACKRNEVNKKMSEKMPGVLDVSDSGNRAQHTSVLLKDVKYRVTADLIARDPAKKAGLCAQAERRIGVGQCFTQPYFGIREYVAYFGPADMSDTPADIDLEMGLVPYDAHDPTACDPGYSGLDLSLFQCGIRNGIIEVPRWGDAGIITLKGGMAVAPGVV